jgi:hypothetical protein
MKFKLIFQKWAKNRMGKAQRAHQFSLSMMGTLRFAHPTHADPC